MERSFIEGKLIIIAFKKSKQLEQVLDVVPSDLNRRFKGSEGTSKSACGRR